jgi:hypothetical protein
MNRKPEFHHYQEFQSPEDKRTAEDEDWRWDCGFALESLTPGKTGTVQFMQKKVTTTQFEASTLKRFEQYEHRRKEKLLVQKKENMLAALESCPMEPSINEQRKKDKRNPLVARLDEILETRKVKLEAKKNSFVSKADKEAKECTFRPSINTR